MALFFTGRNVWNDRPPGRGGISDGAREDLRQFHPALSYLWHVQKQRWEVVELARDGTYHAVFPLERRGVFVPPGEWVFEYLMARDILGIGVAQFLDRMDAEDEARDRAAERVRSEHSTDELKYRHAGVRREYHDLDPNKAGVFAVKPGG